MAKKTSVVSKEDLGTMLICAIRYSLGRQTYMPSLIQEITRKHMYGLPSKDLQIMSLGIGETEKADMLGHPSIDAPGWRELKRDIDKEIARRERDENQRQARNA